MYLVLESEGSISALLEYSDILLIGIRTCSYFVRIQHFFPKGFNSAPPCHLWPLRWWRWSAILCAFNSFTAPPFKRHKWLGWTNSFEIVLNRAKWDILSDSLHITFAQTAHHLCTSLLPANHTQTFCLTITGMPDIVRHCSSLQRGRKKEKKIPPLLLLYQFYNVSLLTNSIFYPHRWVN